MPCESVRAPVTYESPQDLSSALGTLAQTGGQIIAGGTDVYPSQGHGQRAQHYLDVTQITGFRDITVTGGVVRFGAATRWSQIVRADLPPAFDALRQAAREVGSVQIQNAGTLAGNLCNASPAADGVPPLLALDAQVELHSAARGRRVLPLSAFITGVRRTARAADELMTAIIVPKPPETAYSAFEKLGSRRYMVISITMCAAVIALDSAGRINHARVAVGACSPVACRLPALETDLIGQRLADVQVAPHHLTLLSPIDDVRGDAAYRLDAVAEQITRAITRAKA